ncbi:MAG: carbamoyltransferase C-terminal domain-containing protein [bacterium]
MTRVNSTSIFNLEYLEILSGLAPEVYEERFELFLRLLANPEEMGRRHKKLLRRRPGIPCHGGPLPAQKDESSLASDAVALGLAAAAWRKMPTSIGDFPDLLFLSSETADGKPALRLQVFTGGGMPYKNILRPAPCRSLDAIVELIHGAEDAALFVSPEAFHLILDNPETPLLKKVSAMMVFGAPVMPLARRLIAENSRAVAGEVFGNAETGIFAVKVGDCEAHVINPDCYVELLNWDGKSAAAGECGEIVVTVLNDSASPMLRCHTGHYGIRPESSPGVTLDNIKFPVPASGFPVNAQGMILDPATLHAAISQYPITYYHIERERDEIRFEYSCPDSERERVESYMPAVLAEFYAPPTIVTMLRKSRAVDVCPSVISDTPLSGYARLSAVRVSREPGRHWQELFELIAEKCSEAAGAVGPELLNSENVCIHTSSAFREHCGTNAALAYVLENLEKPGSGMSGASPDESTPALHLITWEEANLQALPKDAHTVCLVRTAAADDNKGDDFLLIIPAETARARGRLLVHGVIPEASTRYIVAGPGAAQPKKEYFRIFHSRCERCGTCEALCPARCISARGGRVRIEAQACVRCYLCAEHCRGGAIVPLRALDTSLFLDGFDDLALLCSALSEGGRKPIKAAHGIELKPDLARPIKKTAPPPKEFSQWSKPFNFYFHVRKNGLYILGLSVVTHQEHSAALLCDGHIVGAVHEERLNRIKHYGWRDPRRPWASIAADPSISIEEVLPGKSIRWLIDKAGIAPDRLDFIAINGIPARFRRTFSTVKMEQPPKPLKTGRLLFVPHHIAHAAGAYRASGMDEAFILTVDGRGDRETAAFFTARGGRIERVAEILCLNDASIGGAYETASRALGFGPYGQGAVMALAAMGSPAYDMSSVLYADSFDMATIHEHGIERLSKGLPPPCTEAPPPEHRNFAAGIQQALESAICRLIEDGLARAGAPPDGSGANFCLSGGVALNCAMNRVIKERFKFRAVYVQPAANDSGTSLGAALEAHYLITGERHPCEIRHDFLGPEFDDETIRLFLESNRIPYIKSSDVATDCAKILAAGHVACWFQGAMEFGPRALGARSILADVRNRNQALRLNRMKSREPWRPLAPAIPTGREAEYFVDPAHSPFMLFTTTVREELRSSVPAIVHADGSARPQSVDKDTNPLFHKLILEYERLSGIPMVVNTSFNRGGEPIVCSPGEALDSFFGMDGDFLALGPYIIVNPSVSSRLRRGAPDMEAHRADAPQTSSTGGLPRRVHLRLTTTCNNNCVHCTIRDIRGVPDRSTEESVREMAAARKNGATEIVIMRGEATLREDLFTLVRAARRLGFSIVQLQTNGRALSEIRFMERLIEAGVNWFEVSLYGDSPGLHDAVSRAPGSFAQTVAGLKNIARLGSISIVSVPVVKQNHRRLEQIVELVGGLRIRRVQLNFTRPVFFEERWNIAAVAPLRDCSRFIVKALKKAVSLEIAPSTEAIPLCALDEATRRFGETPSAQDTHSVADLHIRHEVFAAHMAEARPVTPRCVGCSLVRICPGTWAAYLQLMGCEELSPVEPE